MSDVPTTSRYALSLSEVFHRVAEGFGPIRARVDAFPDESAKLDAATIALRDASTDIDATITAQIAQAMISAKAQIEADEQSKLDAMASKLTSALETIATLQGRVDALEAADQAELDGLDEVDNALGDTVTSATGSDTTIGAGTDTVAGAPGDDSMPSATVTNGVGTDNGTTTAVAGASNDSIDATTAADTIASATGNDTVLAANGVDTLDAGATNLNADTTVGAAGNDTVLSTQTFDGIEPGDTSDAATIFGTENNDTISAGSGSGMTIGQKEAKTITT